MPLMLTRAGHAASGGGASFSPDSLAGLQLWHDATDAGSITLNGGNVDTINDKSGNGRHFSQATASQQPPYVSGQYIQFEYGAAGKDFLTGGINASAILSTADNTIFVVLQADAGQLSNGLVYLGDGTFNGLGSNGTGWRCRLWNGTLGQSDINLAAAEGTKYILTLRRYGGAVASTLAGSLNGGPETSVASAGTLTGLAQPWQLPAADSTFKAAYRFHEQVIYNRALSVGEVNQVGQYLAAKHSLSWTDIT